MKTFAINLHEVRKPNSVNAFTDDGRSICIIPFALKEISARALSTHTPFEAVARLESNKLFMALLIINVT
jgi:hypothetical protein